VNQLAPQNQQNTSLASVGMAREGSGSRIAPQNLGEVVKFADLMSRADIALPKHLRGNPGACMAVALQALDWQMNPFAVASKSYSVSGTIAYEAQLIAAVVNTRSGIKGRLRYEYEGEGSTLMCRVTGTLDDTECVYETPTIGSITVKNSPLWKSDPKQQLGYFAARSWARRHCPEVILGVYDRDEAEQIKDVTPPAGTGLAARLQNNGGGFSAQSVEGALGEAQEAQEQPLGADGEALEEVPSTVTVEEPLDPSFVDWNSADETAAALKMGVLPEGFSTNLSGALVIPDDLHGKKGQPRGHSIIAASYDEIVTASGVVVKSKAPPADDDFLGDLPTDGDA
jgi:hypothetical protein